MAGLPAAARTSIARTAQFAGLNNVADPLELGIQGFTRADNVVIDRRRHVLRALGFSKVASLTAPGGAYATKDLQRLYVVDNGNLLQVNADLTTTVLASGLTTGRYQFDEVNGVVYGTDGQSYISMAPGGYRPWGIDQPNGFDARVDAGSLNAGLFRFVITLVRDDGLESCNSPVVAVDAPDGSSIVLTGIEQRAGYATVLYATERDGATFYRISANTKGTYRVDAGVPFGSELPAFNTNPPRGELPAFFDGCIYTAEFYPDLDTTAVWSSLPLQFHQFDPGSEGFSVPGEVRYQRATREVRPTGGGQTSPVLVIGTDREIFAWDGENLRTLANYGVVPGHPAIEHDGHLYLWTLRGLCRAMPFENLTEASISVPPGLRAAAAIIEQQGTTRFVVALHKGGDAFNRYQ